MEHGAAASSASGLWPLGDHQRVAAAGGQVCRGVHVGLPSRDQVLDDGDGLVTLDPTTIVHPSNGIEVASAIAPAIEELRRSSVVAGTPADQRLRPARGESR